MNPNFLDFEQPIAELEAKIQELRHASHGQAFNIDDEVGKLKDKLKRKTADIFKNLTRDAMADRADRASPGASVYARLRADDLQRVP